jgi:hypothetical protein
VAKSATEIVVFYRPGSGKPPTYIGRVTSPYDVLPPFNGIHIWKTKSSHTVRTSDPAKLRKILAREIGA